MSKSNITFGFSLFFAEGSHCTMEQGNPGVCRKLPDCPFRIQEVIEGRRHTTSSGRCGFVKDIEIVCCPINITRKISPRPADVGMALWII